MASKGGGGGGWVSQNFYRPVAAKRGDLSKDGAPY